MDKHYAYDYPSCAVCGKEIVLNARVWVSRDGNIAIHHNMSRYTKNCYGTYAAKIKEKTPELSMWDIAKLFGVSLRTAKYFISRARDAR